MSRPRSDLEALREDLRRVYDGAPIRRRGCGMAGSQR